MGNELAAHPHRREILLLLRTAMAVFVFTVVVGILNGADAVDFSREFLVTHLHTGTLGWITLSVFAGAIWLFTRPEATGWHVSLPRVVAPAAAATVIAYNLAFLTTVGYARPVLGSVAAAAMLAIFGWSVAQAVHLEMSVPRWGLLAALATSVTGGVLGVLWGILIASGGSVNTLPRDGEGAHPATMVVGFLVPAGLALIEWWLRPGDAVTRAPRAGFVQMLLLFLGGFTLMLGVLLNVVPLIVLNLPFMIAAIVIFVARNHASLRAARFGAVGDATPTPFHTAGAVAIVVNLGMLIYLIGRYADDFEAAPRNLILALDHVMFVGLMTNAILGFLLVATGAGRAIAPWADRVVFWLMNIGLAGFWIGFVSDTVWPKRLFTPLMGIGILIGVAVYFRRSLEVGPARQPLRT